MNLDLLPDSTPGALCAACAGECLACCFNDAIVFAPGLGYRVVEENCAGCGACMPACEHGLIDVRQGVARIAQAPAITYAAEQRTPLSIT
jgi:Fe-S-cluster-containing hydrogenase component 2